VTPKPKRSVRARGKTRGKARKTDAPLWRHTAGDHGHAVTVFQKRGKRNLYIEWWSSQKGGMERHSLGHADQELALQQARKMSDTIRLRTQPLISATGEPTLTTLLQLYYNEHGVTLGGQQPAEHDRRRRMWLGFFEQQPRPIVHPRDLDQALFNNFIAERRHGDLDVDGIALPQAAPKPKHKGMKREAVVSDGTIDADLIYLNAALNWATNYMVEGTPLLKSKPKVPRCKPQAGTLRQPVAAEDDLEALRPVLDAVDSQKLLSFWLELDNQFGWRVTGLSHVMASDVDFTPQAHRPHGTLKKNSTVDKERRGDGIPLTAPMAKLLARLLAFRGLTTGDEEYLFPAPRDATKPWSRWHVGRMLIRAEKAAGIAHIGGLHAWRRKWHTERKNYPAQDVAAAAGYADPRSVDRYRHSDPATIYQVVSTPTVEIRRNPASELSVPVADAAGEKQVEATSPVTVEPQTGGGPLLSAAGRGLRVSTSTPTRLRRRSRTKSAKSDTPPAPATRVGQGSGSPKRSMMPDGTVVESRDERFALNLAVAKKYAAEHGHLMPRKHERPSGVNLLQWLKNQEIRIAKGTMPLPRRAELEAMPEWRDRVRERDIPHAD
jgi:hypothetical protein